jgi:IS5 family transposase
VNNKNTPRSGGSPKPKKRAPSRPAGHKPKKDKSKKKRQYRIRNWHDYNTALVQRGSLTLWLDEGALRDWHNQTCTGERGRPRLYTDQAITCALRLKEVYRLPLRATEGLLRSLVALLGGGVSVPSYSTLCRRRPVLKVNLSAPAVTKPLHLVVDGTGLKIFGDGEWKVRQHGVSKRRTWRKVHLAVDEATGFVRAAATTANSVSDGEMLPSLLGQVPDPIAQVSADGGYDWRTCYDAIAGRGARAVIPPRRGAKLWRHGNSRQERLARDENLRRVREVGRPQWKRESGYHRRSLAETAVFRLKTIFGGTLSARKEAAQDRETLLRLSALNLMTALGMPESYAV